MESSKVRTERKVVSGTHKQKNKTYRLGELIELCDERNTEGKYTDFCGLNIEKQFMPTVADINGLDEKNYKIVRKNRFVFSGMQTGRDGCIRLGLFSEDNPIIISPAYTTFEISRIDIIMPEYFFMIFQSREMDRYGAFCSDGSIRTNLDLERFCDFKLTLPPLTVQQKYVAVYKALQKNLAAYENGLEDLKLTCDGFIDKIKNETSDVKDVKHCRLGELIELFDERNVDGKYTLNDVKGISTDKTFIETKADMNGVSLNSYKIVKHDEFAYVADTSRRGDKIALAYNDSKESLLISSIYTTFRVSHRELLLSGYLSLLFTRSEFDRYARFSSWGSARETFDWNEMCDVKIPLPSIDIQQDIVNIYNVYIERQRIAVELRQKRKTLCPLLIKGSLEEK